MILSSFNSQYNKKNIIINKLSENDIYIFDMQVEIVLIT